MIPKKISPYFKTTLQKRNGNNTLIEGALICCNSHEFEVKVVGEIKCSMLSKMYLLPENENTVLEVRCKKCGKVISVFDSSCDGYGQCEKSECECTPTNSIGCKKCLHNDFSVYVKYEYPDLQELEELEINETDNAFTWIWITLECNKCGTKYRNFIDLETT